MNKRLARSRTITDREPILAHWKISQKNERKTLIGKNPTNYRDWRNSILRAFPKDKVNELDKNSLKKEMIYSSILQLRMIYRYHKIQVTNETTTNKEVLFNAFFRVAEQQKSLQFPLSCYLD